jgi:4-oxalocrotonate tautomerase
MPWVTVNMLEGRSEKNKLKLHQAVSKAVAESLDVPIELVHVQIVEMKGHEYSLGGVPSSVPKDSTKKLHKIK